MKTKISAAKLLSLVSALVLLLDVSVFALAEDQAATAINKEAFDALIASGPVADAQTIAASEWATAVKEAGVLRIGGTRTSFLFSQLDETDNGVRGFDAGLYQLLARYILGDETKYELTQVTSSTRESVLTSGQVDAVFATYSITPSRQEVISFAGPYYTSQQAILIKAGKEPVLTPIDDMTISCRTHCICPPGTARKCTQRRQVPGSNAFVPSVVGLIIAGEVVKELAGWK